MHSVILPHQLTAVTRLVENLGYREALTLLDDAACAARRGIEVVEDQTPATLNGFDSQVVGLGAGSARTRLGRLSSMRELLPPSAIEDVDRATAILGTVPNAPTRAGELPAAAQAFSAAVTAIERAHRTTAEVPGQIAGKLLGH